MCMSSCTSWGSTSLRDHDSSHRGLGGATGWLLASPAFAARDPSLEPKTFLKKGIVMEVNSRSAPSSLAACAVGGRGRSRGGSTSEREQDKVGRSVDGVWAVRRARDSGAGAVQRAAFLAVVCKRRLYRWTCVCVCVGRTQAAHPLCEKLTPKPK